MHPVVDPVADDGLNAPPSWVPESTAPQGRLACHTQIRIHLAHGSAYPLVIRTHLHMDFLDTSMYSMSKLTRMVVVNDSKNLLPWHYLTEHPVSQLVYAGTGWIRLIPNEVTAGGLQKAPEEVLSI